jgi:hypothetical protein
MHRLTTLDLPSDGERRACGNLLGEQVFARFRFSAARACALVRKEARAQSTLFQHHGPLAGGHSQVSTCPIGLFERVHFEPLPCPSAYQRHRCDGSGK